MYKWETKDGRQFCNRPRLPFPLRYGPWVQSCGWPHKNVPKMQPMTLPELHGCRCDTTRATLYANCGEMTSIASVAVNLRRVDRSHMIESRQGSGTACISSLAARPFCHLGLTYNLPQCPTHHFLLAFVFLSQPSPSKSFHGGVRVFLPYESSRACLFKCCYRPQTEAAGE